MLDGGIPLLEKVIRTIAVYLTLMILLRLAGRRELAQLTGSDLVVMLLLSNVVQNAIIGPDNSLIGGLIGAAVLLMANEGLARVWSSWLGRWFRPRTTVLAKDGAYDARQLKRLRLRDRDVDQAVLEQGGDSVADTRLVTMEPGGAVLVRLRRDEQNASYGDVQELRERLERIERLLLDQTRRDTRP